MTTPETRARAALARAHSTSIRDYEAVADAIRGAKREAKKEAFEEALREVERGDTVDKILRSFLETIADCGDGASYEDVAEFIAEVDPNTVLDLINRIEELEESHMEKNRRAKEVLDAHVSREDKLRAERDAALEVLDRATQHNPPIPVTTPDKALDNIVSDELDEHGYKVGWNACLGAFRDWLREQVAGVDTDEGDGDAEP